jgi:hypothetical protein
MLDGEIISEAATERGRRQEPVSTRSR